MEMSIDIELSNRCNAKCHFCPRDQTPHQGSMTPEVFDRALSRAVEYQREILTPLFGLDAAVNLCGLGEPLLNRHAATFVAQTRAAGFLCGMSSNGSLLDERRGAALLDAGLQRILINVAERGDDYEAVYQLPFEKTRDNVVRFVELAQGRCDVSIVLVDHRRDPEHLERMKAFWRDRGVHRFMVFDVINRGGALFVDHMQYSQYPEMAEARRLLLADGVVPICGAPFVSLFVGYDGQYYLCCSDWKKEVPLGSVHDVSFLQVTREKLHQVMSRETVCQTCNLDPVNRLTEELRAVNAGESDTATRDALIDSMVSVSRTMHEGIDRLLAQPGSEGAPRARRLIPVQAE